MKTWKDDWESILDTDFNFSETHRLRVPGGWVVRWTPSYSPTHSAMCFVPDQSHEWKLELQKP